MANLTVNFPSQIQSVTFSNGNTATNRSGSGIVSYTSRVTITSVSMAGGYLSWSGTLYWKNSSGTSYKFAEVSNGNVRILSHETIDYTGNRTITIVASQAVDYTLTCSFEDSIINNVTFTNGNTAQNRSGVGYITYTSSVKISSATLGSGYSSWNGNLYWRNSAGTSYKFAQVSDGVVYPLGSSLQEEISCTGNRTITFYGEGYFTLKYRVHAFGNGGTTSGGASESWWPSDQSYWNSSDSSFDFPLTRLPSFTKPNSTFVGWAYGSTPTAGESVYTTTIRLSASASGTTNNLHAVWESYTYTLKYDANGGSNPPADQTYGPTADRSHSFVIPSKLPTRANYLFVGWASSSTATEAGYHPGDSASVLNTSPNQTRTLYAVWKSKIGVEPHFYWYNRDDPMMTDAEKEAFDYTKIKSGLTREMTAVMWAAFADKTERLARLCGTSVSVARPGRGTEMFASQYNNGIYALQFIKNALYSSAYIPDTVRSEIDYINASQFHGNASIKTCLNRLIDDYNNGGGGTYDN